MKPTFEHDPDKIVWTAAYQDERHRNSLAWSLISFGSTQFKRATIIDQLASVELSMRTRNAGHTTMEAFSEFIQPFIWEQLMDDIRICVFFENYMKAILLFKGAIIHKFQPVGSDHNKVKQLNKAQKAQPLGFECIALNNITDAEFSRNTISMDLMLGDGYQKVIKLSDDVRRIVTMINARRNRLHLHNSLQVEISEAIVKDYRILDAFVEDWAQQIRKAQKEAGITA